MSTPPDLQPDIGEVLQEEHYDSAAVKVCVESVKSPVRTQELPRKAGATRTRPVGSTSAVQVLSADRYRAQAELVAFTQDVFIAYTAASAAEPSRMSRWPALVPKVITSTTAVWVLAVTGTTDVSITTELWATGE